MTTHPILRAAIPARSALFLALSCALFLAGCNTTPPPAPAAADQNSAAPSASNTQPAATTSSAESSFAPGKSRSRRSRPLAQSKPGVFDFYLLTLSWSPEFCASNPSSPECAAHPGFVVHGLWPQNTNGTFPEDCSSAPGPTNPSSFLDLIPTLSLIAHEWTTHGTCSGLAANAYFNEIRTDRDEVKIPADFASTQPPPAALSPTVILTQFAAANPTFPKGAFAISCGNNFLTAVEACFDKNLHPEACQGVRTCGATSIKITPR